MREMIVIIVTAHTKDFQKAVAENEGRIKR
jgi:hypothetical protein